MKIYQFQLVAPAQTSDAVRRFICSDDVEALLLAAKMTKGIVPAEVWDGDRLVGKLARANELASWTTPARWTMGRSALARTKD
jgi:hypothetical protein